MLERAVLAALRVYLKKAGVADPKILAWDDDVMVTSPTMRGRVALVATEEAIYVMEKGGGQLRGWAPWSELLSATIYGEPGRFVSKTHPYGMSEIVLRIVTKRATSMEFEFVGARDVCDVISDRVSRNVPNAVGELSSVSPTVGAFEGPVFGVDEGILFAGYHRTQVLDGEERVDRREVEWYLLRWADILRGSIGSDHARILLDLGVSGDFLSWGWIEPAGGEGMTQWASFLSNHSLSLEKASAAH